MNTFIESSEKRENQKLYKSIVCKVFRDSIPKLMLKLIDDKPSKFGISILIAI